MPRLVKAGLVWDAKSAVREMEHWTRDVGGFQALYTDIFCTPNELRQMFDFTLLDAARARLNCEDAVSARRCKPEERTSLLVPRSHTSSADLLPDTIAPPTVHASPA